MKILFISRAYPPVTGGIENQNYELSQWLPTVTPTDTIANTRGRIFLPIFGPYALIRTLCTMHKYDAILLGDGVLTFIGWFVKLFSNKPVISVVHGLDINYDSSSLNVWYEKFLIAIYQRLWVKTFFKKIDHYIAVGNETIKTGIKHGISKEKISFIPNGVTPENFDVSAITKDEIFTYIDQKYRGKKMILTFGRLAKRKGVAWFIRNVLPRLDEDIIYIVAGNGPDKQNVLDAVEETGLNDRVVVMGYVPDEQRNAIFAGVDAFVQPNITVSGDMEGFGISVIEAGAGELPVLASHLEGLKDAIKDGENGFSLPSGDVDAWTQKVTEVLSDDFDREAFGKNARKYIIDHLSWEKIAKDYVTIIKQVTKK